MQPHEFKILGDITHVETIARKHGIRHLADLKKKLGPGQWRKMKGRAQIEYPDGKRCYAEIHWYEAHGIGKKDFKVKYELD